MGIDVEESLVTLDTVLHQLARIQRERRQALGRVDTAALETLADEEGAIGRELYRALTGAAPAGDGGESIAALGNLGAALDGLEPAERARTEERIRSLAQRASAAQAELTGNYFITHRLHQQVTDLLDILACAEGPAFTEGSDPASGGAGQGVFLDNRA